MGTVGSRAVIAHRHHRRDAAFMKSLTPILHGPSLCQSCRHATIVKGAALNQEIVECDELSRPQNLITFRVTECSKHDDRSTPSLASMQRIAWELCTDKQGRKIGFLSPIDRRNRKDLADTGGYIDSDDL